MGASNTPLYDLVELSSLNDNTTFTTAAGGGGDIIGLVDNATYTDGDASNSATEIQELNETFSVNGGTLTIDGVDYNIQLVVPDGSFNNVTVTYDGGGSSVDLSGNGSSSQIVFIVASPVGGGSDRYFAAIDDTVGALPDISSIQIRNLDWNPAGDDVMINLDQDNIVTICFAEGTRILTPAGERKVERLNHGDQVVTQDHGPQRIRWIGASSLTRSPALQPIRIAANALGPGIPHRPLFVSPQHRMLVRSAIAQRMTGKREVLIAAKKLTDMRGIHQETRPGQIRYFHILCDAHEVIFAEGAPAETLLPGPQVRQLLGSKLWEELATIYPQIAASLSQPDPVRPVLRGHQKDSLTRRHRKNRIPLVQTTP